jgi:hypothetical protein
MMSTPFCASVLLIPNFASFELFWIEIAYSIFIYKYSEHKKLLDIQIVQYIIFYKYTVAVQNVDKVRY